jgi:hypothetical protein
MARFLVIAVTVLLAARADTVVYVSVAAEKRIAVYQMDGATGKVGTGRGVADNCGIGGQPGGWADL